MVKRKLAMMRYDQACGQCFGVLASVLILVFVAGCVNQPERFEQDLGVASAPDVTSRRGRFRSRPANFWYQFCFKAFTNPYLRRYIDAVDFEFTGVVLDSKGEPIAGAIVELRPNVIPENGEPHLLRQIQVELETDAEGRFVYRATGTRVRVVDVHVPNMQLLYDTRSGYPAVGPVPSNLVYEFHSYEYAVNYFPDPESPAVFVMMAEGDSPVVWPSRGGSDEFHRVVYVNEPTRPEEPSVPLSTPE